LSSRKGEKYFAPTKCPLAAYFYLVIPLIAGIKKFDERNWVPAFAGTTQIVGWMSEALSAMVRMSLLME
jgi:hypothetical protein